MQKLINALAVLSFLGTASIIGGGVYVYLQKDALIESVRKRSRMLQQKQSAEHFLECWMQQCRTS